MIAEWLGASLLAWVAWNIGRPIISLAFWFCVWHAMRIIDRWSE